MSSRLWSDVVPVRDMRGPRSFTSVADAGLLVRPHEAGPVGGQPVLSVWHVALALLELLLQDAEHVGVDLIDLRTAMKGIIILLIAKSPGNCLSNTCDDGTAIGAQQRKQ